MSTLSVSNLSTLSGEDVFVKSSFQGGFNFRNKIINGDMRIDQRNAGASVTPANGDYTLDRWNVLVTQTSRFSVQRNAGAVTPPSGFTNYIGATSLGVTTLGSSDRFVLQQSIEGHNVSDLDFGTSNAKSIAVSFWVRSSITGTHSAVIIGGTGPRSYPFTYSVVSANTWEYKTVTVPGDTFSGTWGTTNDIGISIRFNLGSGSGQVNSANSWSTSNVCGATGSVNILVTNGATFYITGVQLEVGSVATPFERRPIGIELMMCQRYYLRWKTGGTFGFSPFFGPAPLTTLVQVTYSLPVEMRVTPFAVDTGGSLRVTDKINNYAVTSIFLIGDAELGTTRNVGINITVSSGLTTFRTYYITSNNDNNSYIGLSAEL